MLDNDDVVFGHTKLQRLWETNLSLELYYYNIVYICMKAID